MRTCAGQGLCGGTVAKHFAWRSRYGIRRRRKRRGALRADAPDARVRHQIFVMRRSGQEISGRHFLKRLSSRLLSALTLCFAGWGLASTAMADMEVSVDATPGLVRLPDNWRPIPRAEIVEARERAAKSTSAALPPLPAAAFQRLPTLQWFTLPHALVYWQPSDAVPENQDDAKGAAEQLAPDLRVSEDLGRGPRGLSVHAWHCHVVRHDGRFRIELLTADEDGRALILQMAEGLRDSK